MALKKFDIPEIDDAISDAKHEELLRKQQAEAEKIAAILNAFLTRSPDIINAMRAVIPLLDAKKFSAQLSEDLRKSADGMAVQVGDSLRKSAGEVEKSLMANITPLVERMEHSEKRVSIPSLAFYVIITTLVFLAAFFALVIFANAHSLHSAALSKSAIILTVCWGLGIAGIICMSRKP